MIEPTDETLRRWLLGRLAPEEAAPLEQRLLEDDAFGEVLRAAETDLLDDLARGTLDANDRKAAVRCFAAPQDRERLRFAAAFARIAVPSKERRGIAHPARVARPHRFGARRTIAAAVFASACAAAIVVVGLRRHEVEPFVTEPSGAQTTITLMVGQQRGAALDAVAISQAASTIRLQVEVDAADPATRYTLSIEDASKPVFAAHDLAAREAGAYRFVEVTLAASTLGVGEHRVSVGVEGASTPASTWTMRTRAE